MYQEPKSLKETEFLPSVRAARAENARMNAHARKILKCSKWSDMYSRSIRIEFWAFLNFDARIRAHHDAHDVVNVHDARYWLEIYVCQRNYENDIQLRRYGQLHDSMWKKQNGAYVTSRMTDFHEKLIYTTSYEC